MPLVSAKLASELGKIELFGSDPEAAAAWANAWFAYLTDVTGAGIPAAKPALLGLKSLMITTMLGMSAPDVGPQKIQDGIVAVWTAMVPMTSTIFSGTIPPLTPPPGMNQVAAAIRAITPTNTAPGITKEVAYRNLANAIHPLMVAGGLVTLPGTPPITGPIL
jgi:hypothetical protein